MKICADSILRVENIGSEQIVNHGFTSIRESLCCHFIRPTIHLLLDQVDGHTAQREEFVMK